MAVKRIEANRLEKSNILPESPLPSNAYFDQLFRGRITHGSTPTPTQERLPGDLWHSTLDGRWYYWTGTLWKDMTVGITGDPGFMTAADKVRLNGMADNANNYVHPTGPGNLHLPSGGTVGQVLTNTGDGTGDWSTIPAAPTSSFAQGTTYVHGLTAGAQYLVMGQGGARNAGTGGATEFGAYIYQCNSAGTLSTLLYNMPDIYINWPDGNFGTSVSRVLTCPAAPYNGFAVRFDGNNGYTQNVCAVRIA